MFFFSAKVNRSLFRESFAQCKRKEEKKNNRTSLSCLKSWFFQAKKKNVFIHVVGRKCQFTFFHSIMKRVSGEKNITRGNHYNLLDSLRAAKRSAVQKLLHLLIKISPWKKRHCRGRKISMNDTVDGRNGSLGVKCNSTFDVTKNTGKLPSL